MRRPQIVTRRSSACIEGFPRSGNWFALRTFLDANPDAGEVGHHIHLAGQVSRALRYEVPCLVLVRDPVAAVASFLVFERRLTPRLALWSWIRYHETIARHGDSIEICPFEQLVDRPESVVTRLNRRYRSGFRAPSLDEGSRSAALERIARSQRHRHDARTASTPRPERREANELARARVRSERRLDHAVTLYAELVDAAGPPPARP